MALVSPGLEITVSDESQYVPGAVATVPLVLLATAQDKTNPSGKTAGGTTVSNAGKLQVFTSQRELSDAFGYPTFYQSTAGTPLHGDERNEYGLMAAYSALGVGNRLYAIRADIDLAQIEPAGVRPVGTVANNTNWFDISANSDWGVYEWNATDGEFSKKTPLVVTDPGDLVTNIPFGSGTINAPSASIGSIGSYAIVLTPDNGGSINGSNWILYKKNRSNVWNLVGLAAWKQSMPTVKATVAAGVAQDSVTVGNLTYPPTITINNTDVVVGSESEDKAASFVVSQINTAAITGVTAAVVDGKVEIYATDAAASDGSTSDGKIAISNKRGTPLADLGIAQPKTYANPKVEFGSYVNIPAWRSTDAVPRPTGSIFVKSSATGAGANLVFKRYNSSTDTWTNIAAPLYLTPTLATYGLDSSGGGYNIKSGSIFVRYDSGNLGLVTYKPYVRINTGVTKVTGAVVGAAPFTAGHSFTLKYSKIGQSTLTSVTVTITGSGAKSKFPEAVLAANIPEVTSAVEANGAISLTHLYGGVIVLSETSPNTAIANAGFSASTSGVVVNQDGELELSGWEPLTYTHSISEPTQDPEDGTLWYYGAAGGPAEVDIMINTTDGWKGYQLETSDSRGYDLSATDPSGVIVSASRPTTQTDDTDLVAGDIWLDTSDLENWPKLSRYNGTKWIAIDNTDQVSPNGIIFADARWDTDGTTDPVAADFPDVVDLLTSNYLDLDAPDYRLYPRGMLLLNTRRSGYNIKRFVSNYFNTDTFNINDWTADDAYSAGDKVVVGTTVYVATTSVSAGQAAPTSNSSWELLNLNSWVSSSGLKNNGSMWAGRQAQRQLVVEALKAAVDANTDLREDQYQFNLIVSPGYPELIQNMVGLNNDRANTAFVIGDTPFRLLPSGTDIIKWSNNSDNETGLTTNDPYLGVYYPGAALTNDLGGQPIIVPSSHIALRTMIRSDNVSYQWFAPAGTRRGLVDNASSIGYIDPITNEYNPIGVNQGLRDTLYENKINPITNLPGIGLVVWGQKTRNPVASSMDRINVARLVNYIRTILATVGNGFLFEPNDKITRDQIKAIISGAINDLIAKRGIYDYLVVCDESNNTPTRIARNELYVDIAIEPMKAVEFIYIPIRLYNPGAIAQLGA